ncbi:uroporphyrinogen-III synthase [Sandarakinorhabdus sp.]|uniref:uroporphyrinogen-III synthase n=1 Tax=Sandarakinorhabdus sp. TaxID=1916663 RepID=UPI00286EB091|nr:uroporphyrinogen-III synthase [Sandarakinorhabdus sp.]
MRFLVTRPRPGADATAAALAALGHDALVMPLSRTVPLPWPVPDTAPDAVMITSAAALRHAGAAALRWRHLPLLAVGGATAEAARAVGFSDVREGAGTVQQLLDGLAAAGPLCLLHLAGEDRTPVTAPAHIVLDVRPVYAARLLPMPALPLADVALVYSARTGRHFAAEWDRLGGDRAALGLVAISPAALAAAGTGWRETRCAAAPTEAAMLALAVQNA